MRQGALAWPAAACAATAIVAAAGPARAQAPAGATARCRDGTYSYSQHRSGTCSYHGGVAAWLDAAGAAGPRLGQASVGTTVLLARRTRAAGCTLGPDPDRRCSPGAFYSRLTTAVICSSTFRTSRIRDVPESEKHAVEAEYGLAPGSYGSALEIDHIVSLELGGSNDIANLFPEQAAANPGYRVKDRLENRLHDLVCWGAITLRAAQTRIATDWQALYRAVYGRAP
jgi:hypothetical protein